MSVLSLASGASLWRGYEYYKAGKVIENIKISDYEFTGKVSGSGKSVYDVKINLDHPRKSVCNCPFANGKRIICKHQVALYFAVFPKEAEDYYQEVVRAEEEAERQQEEIEDKVIEAIQKMDEDELRQALCEILFDGPYWQYENFARRYTNYW